MSQETTGQTPQEWAVLFYLCGHYNRPGEHDPFVAALDDLKQTGATAHVSAAIYLDLESGAQRIALRAGEPADSELLGPVNSGDPRTLEAFLAWAFDACPAQRYILVMAGLGIMDADSVVGRPPFDCTRTFAICDDRATADALELQELSATLKSAFPADGTRRLVLLACDMYAMQFMEVAYELRGAVDLIVGIQPGNGPGPPLQQWPYSKLLKRWQDIVAAPVKGAEPRWRSTVDAHGIVLAKETIALLAEHYTALQPERERVTVSAINLQALVPLAQALDTFSVVLLQWLSNDVIWRARENVVKGHQTRLEQSWSYDLDDVASAIGKSLENASAEALARWAATFIPTLSYPQLSAMLRALGASARDLGKTGDGSDVYRTLASEISACRSAVERVISIATSETDLRSVPQHKTADIAVRRLFTESDDSDEVRHSQPWSVIVLAARERPAAVMDGRELADALEGIEAAKQLGHLAKRVSDLARGADAGQPAVTAVWPAGAKCGLSLYRPIDLDKLAESNYLHLRFSRELHWTALLTAVDLIKNHARMLWRLLESQLTAAPLEARYQLMRRLAGDRALTGRHADQLQALSAPDALFLTIEPVEGPPGASAAGPEVATGDSEILWYCIRLSSLDRSATVVEHRNQITRARLRRVLAEIDTIGSDVDAPPERTLQRLARCGSQLGDDLLYGISDRLGEVEPVEGRAVHLVLQIPRELMRYPWELLRDRRGWLVDRFAIGRQVIADTGTVPRWTSSRRQGPLRLLVVAPAVEGGGSELAGAGALEGAHVAEAFARLQERLPGIVDPSNFKKYVDQPVTVEHFRALLRERRYDIVHFAGHGRYDAAQPERSCWLFSDGPLYAFELRHTLANAQVTPWLIYGSACEGAQDGSDRSTKGAYHDGVYGMASAALGEGVAAYLGPLWKIKDVDAKNMAVAFYEALLMRRASLGDALSLARRSVREGQPDLDQLTVLQEGADPDGVTRLPQSAGWTGLVLYGDPTPTVLQRLSPSDVGPAPVAGQIGSRAGRREVDPDNAEQIA